MLLVCCFALFFFFFSGEFSVKNVFVQKPNDMAGLCTLWKREGLGPLCLTHMPRLRHCSIPNLSGLVNGFKWILGDMATWCHPVERG